MGGTGGRGAGGAGEAEPGRREGKWAGRRGAGELGWGPQGLGARTVRQSDSPSVIPGASIHSSCAGGTSL